MDIIRWFRGVLYIVKIDIYAEYISALKNRWQDIQKKNLTYILQYAKKNCSFYNNFLPDNISKNNCIDILKCLPIINKQIIREQKTSFYSREISENWSSWANTGGSTGEPFRFPSLMKGNLEGLCQRLLYKRMGSYGGLFDLIISIDGTRIEDSQRDRNIFWGKNLLSFPYGKYSLSTIYMSPLTLPYYISFLNEKKPSILRGYPSGVLDIARYIKENKVELSFTLKGVYLTSESFDKLTESYISDVFSCPVYGQYGHTEASIFAIKNPEQDDYLTFPLYGYTEILDDSGNHVKQGESGRIVVTGFSHYGTPFLRYDTGDLAIYGGTLEDGSVVLTSLLGRTVDYIVNSNKEKIFLIGFIFGGHLRAFNYIKKWQIEQNVEGRILLRIVKGEGYDKSIENEVIELFASKGISVEIQYVEMISRTSRGKEKFIIQNLVN